jgi:hypothetical protein
LEGWTHTHTRCSAPCAIVAEEEEEEEEEEYVSKTFVPFAAMEGNRRATLG